MSECTLILIKPDGVKRQLVGEILHRIERKGYTLAQMKMLTPTESLLAQHYSEHLEKPFYPALLEFMLSGPVVAAVFEGEEVVEAIRTIMGPSNPVSAPAGTIRGDYGRAWSTSVQQNLIHGSDSVASAEREIAIWFNS
ncbi:nucleoside-diphosphate kinase [Rothia sp. CCM 9418]|uniref:nucleoside-diphosphate kinase n=1 Tax=Rothia sp. CCM 9418 TaxID=3402661 RepID=UPI003ADA9B3F